MALLTLVLSGCTLHQRGSQAIEFNPLNFGSGDPVFSPANGHGYTNGQPWDNR